MLPENVTQLLAAYVDGELSPQEREIVMRLLNKSTEAREFVRQVQENAHRIKQLPKHTVEPSLVDEIMAAIVEQMEKPTPAVPKYSRRPWLPYVAATLAASLLVATLGIVYWRTMVVDHNPVTPDDQKNVVKNGHEKKQPDPEPQPVTPKKNPLIDQLVKGTFGEFGKPVPVDPPFSATFAELQNGAKSGQFAIQVNRTNTVNLDVAVKNNRLAMDRLKSVLEDHKIKLVADPSATKTLVEKNPPKVEYVVFAENLTSDEVSKLMRDLSQSFVVGEGMNQRMVASPYHKVTVTPIAKDDKQKLIDLIGAPAAQKADPKAERQALVLPITGAAATPSAELTQFTNQRRPQTGTLQVLIKIRQE